MPARDEELQALTRAVDRCTTSVEVLTESQKASIEVQRSHEVADQDRHVELVRNQVSAGARLDHIEKRLDRAEGRIEDTDVHEVVDLRTELASREKDRVDARRHLVTTLVAVGLALLSTGVAIVSIIHPH